MAVSGANCNGRSGGHGDDSRVGGACAPAPARRATAARERDHVPGYVTGGSARAQRPASRPRDLHLGAIRNTCNV
ncbi:hypothetical protein EVAR_100212_1 [Eumeta japonica]|uniref:Uncharacterized protein n=1 Tax=Eumeta variegata TaxID=151549 RepID=A0A4C1ZMT4_EUMVA|nr:hypothetical protein EVAR_100212_1 [Eumeta japonica]